MATDAGLTWPKTSDNRTFLIGVITEHYGLQPPGQLAAKGKATAKGKGKKADEDVEVDGGRGCRPCPATGDGRALAPSSTCAPARRRAGHAGGVDALPSAEGGRVAAQPFRVVKQAMSSSNLASSAGSGGSGG